MGLRQFGPCHQRKFYIRHHRCEEIGRIGIGDNQFRFDIVSILEMDTDRRAILDVQKGNSLPHHQANPVPLHQANQSVNNRTRPAFGKEHAERVFEKMDQTINTRRIERISANQKRLDGKGPSQLVMFEMGGNKLPDSPIRFEPEQSRHLFQHQEKTIERPRGELGKPDVKQSLRMR